MSVRQGIPGTARQLALEALRCHDIGQSGDHLADGRYRNDVFSGDNLLRRAVLGSYGPDQADAASHALHLRQPGNEYLLQRDRFGELSVSLHFGVPLWKFPNGSETRNDYGRNPSCMSDAIYFYLPKWTDLDPKIGAMVSCGAQPIGLGASMPRTLHCAREEGAA